MIPVPEPKEGLAGAFDDSTPYLPKYEDIPEEYKNIDHHWVRFVSGWFFNGIKQEQADVLVAREGVDKKKALKAVHVVLRSFEISHEHKEAGAAFLMNEWFE